MSPDRPTPLLVCRFGDARVGIEASLIREILPLLPLWRPPGLPRPMAGFVSVRGETLPVLAPAVLLGHRADLGVVEGYSHIIRPHGASGRWPCLLVDRVEDFVSADPAIFEPVAPEASFNGTFVAEVRLSDGLIHMVSLDALLDQAERARVQALTEEAERRSREWSRTDHG